MNPVGFSSSAQSRPAPITLLAVYFFYTTVVLRTLAESEALGSWLFPYLALEVLFGILFTLTLCRPIRSLAWKQSYFIFQSFIPLFLVILHPQLDFTNVLVVILSFQAALVFTGWKRWTWVAILIALIVLPLAALLGIYGVALSLLPAAVAIIFPALVVITRDLETGQRKQQALLVELQEANQRLTAYAGQVEEMTAIQERSRLARELHDSVSQTMFSIGLHSRAARILLERDPEKLLSQLEKLQALTQNALEEMRSLISELHPQGNTPDEQTTT